MTLLRHSGAATASTTAAVAAVAGGGCAYASAYIAGPAQYPPTAPAVAAAGGGGSSTLFVQEEDLKALKELLFWAQDIVHARITIADNDDDTAMNKSFKALTNRYCSYVATLD
jgi:hypothetical protein